MRIRQVEPTDFITAEDSAVASIPVYGGQSDDLPTAIMNHEFRLSIGRNQEERDWKTQTNTFFQVFQRLLDHKPAQKKNGNCFMQGGLLEGVKQRTIPNVETLDMLILDLDSGDPIEDVIAKLIEHGTFAVIYSTWSHGTTRTEIKVDALKQRLKMEQAEAITTAHVRHYLKTFQRYNESIVSTCEYVGNEQVGDKGVCAVVKHVPMPKFRVVIPLASPFVIASVCNGSEKAARDLWKGKYVGVAHMLGAAYDRSCTDISRLFFWPTHPQNPEYRNLEPFVAVVVGKALDLDAVEEKDAKDFDVSNPFTQAGFDDEDRTPLETTWLGKKMRGRYNLFRAGEFFETYNDDGRLRNRNGNKITVMCPFDDGHGKNAGNPNDQGFYCVDATGDDGFQAFCSHDSCSQYRKLNFVDKAIQVHGVSEEDFEQFFDVLAECVGHSDSANGEEGDVQTGTALIERRIGDLTPATVGKVSSVLELIAKADVADLVSEPWLKQIVKQTGGTLPTVRKAYRDLQKTSQREAEEAKAAKEGEIWIPARGDFKAIEREALGAIKRKNNPPFLFNDHGTLITLREDKVTKRLIRENVTKDRLSWLLNEVATFYQQSDSGRISTSPPLDVVNNIFASPRHLLPVPAHARVVYHPVLSRDGLLVTKQGHDPMTGVYVHIPDLRLLPVSAEPDEGEVQEAYDWLFGFDGLFGDFPFKDAGDDEAREKDPDHDVGQSTRAHVLALMLLPIIRGVIDGPVPAFVINKPMPGAGSGLFANVWNRALNGRDCPTFAPPKRGGSEELDKLIFGKLLSDPDSPMFFDNVERLESNSLASAITSGNYAGRKLGVSEVMTMDVRHVWLFSGNNIDPSDELARRMIPINIMPDVARPELRSDFYHKDLPGWCMEYRPELIWSLCTLVQNWVAKGMKDGRKNLGSFDRWARVTSGILEAAGVDGFLGNLASWRDLSSSANQQDDEGIEAIFRRVGAGVWFKAGEVFDHFYEDATRSLLINVPVRGRDEQGMRTSFGTFLKNRKDKIYEIDGRTLKLSIRPGKPVEYRFTQVTEQKRAKTPDETPRLETAE